MRNGADESATVLAFIAALATLSRSLDEKISKTTKGWLKSHGVQLPRRGEALPEGPAQRALDALLMEAMRTRVTGDAAASAPA